MASAFARVVAELGFSTHSTHALALSCALFVAEFTQPLFARWAVFLEE